MTFSNLKEKVLDTAFVKLETSKAVQDIDGLLYQLGWTRKHPRIENFLCEVAIKEKIPILKLELVPLKYLGRLTEFLQLYYQCEQLLKKFNFGWDDSIVKEAIAEYGSNINRLSLLGWHHLYECLENQYFLMDMPKPEAKKKKSKSLN